MFIKSFYVLTLALTIFNNVRAECRDAIPKTTPDQTFIIHDDGTVTHNTTGLMWMRCLVGQTWDGGICNDIARAYTWQNALQAAHGFVFAGYSDWRMPNIKELVSIVEQACYDPAINTIVFPNMPGFSVWSSSPKTQLPWNAWQVDFKDGNITDRGQDTLYRIRLVRGGQ